MTVALNAYNVVVAHCAAEYLGMHEIIEKGNLIHIIEVFLSSSVFHIWEDSIIVLQTTKSLLSLSEDLRVISHCVNPTASKAFTDVARVSEVPWVRSLNSAEVCRSVFDLDSRGLSYSMPFHEFLVQRRANDLQMFSFSELKSVTRGFSRALTMGEGVFGYMYRGVVRVHADGAPDSKMDVAVKQLEWVPWAE